MVPWDRKERIMTTDKVKEGFGPDELAARLDEQIVDLEEQLLSLEETKAKIEPNLARFRAAREALGDGPPAAGRRAGSRRSSAAKPKGKGGKAAKKCGECGEISRGGPAAKHCPKCGAKKSLAPVKPEAPAS